MSSGFEGIIAQLKDEQLRLSSLKDELAATLRDVDEDIKRAQAAIAALGANSVAKRTAGRKLAATREQIASHISDALRQLGTLDFDALRADVKSRIRNQGLSCLGFDTRFQEALHDERFNESPAGWKLVESVESRGAREYPEAVHQ